jgi:hypothetical protein
MRNEMKAIAFLILRGGMGKHPCCSSWRRRPLNNEVTLKRHRVLTLTRYKVLTLKR